jgi:crotonobetainyl-CoA:carnitine CoA-transferase CaiB-like acyl-CoA transferase
MRERNYEQLRQELATVFSTKDRSHWLERLIDNDVPCGPLNTVAEAMTDPQAMALRMARTFGRGKRAMPLVGYAIDDPQRPEDEPDRPVPLLGEHTAQILEELGLSDAAGSASLSSTS